MEEGCYMNINNMMETWTQATSWQRATEIFDRARFREKKDTAFIVKPK